MHLRNHPVSRVRLRRGSVNAYLAAVGFVAVATVVREGVSFVLGDNIFIFSTYYPAVLFATYIGGLEVGCFTLFLGGIIGWWVFIPPHFQFFPLAVGSATRLLGYVFSASLIIWGANSYRRLAGRLEDEESLRKLAVQELAHRLKNKIATIQSIISYQLRSQPELRANIIDRLVALSATDDLIMATQGRGASIRDVLSTELGAYEVARVRMDGPDIFLPPRFAMTLALLIYELATNAAKYGALSSPTGSLSVRWSLADQLWELEWRETGGPTVGPQTHHGFGLQLLSAALGEFNGTAETVFEPNGVVCKMKATLVGSVTGTVLQVVNEPTASLDPAV